MQRFNASTLNSFQCTLRKQHIFYKLLKNTFESFLLSIYRIFSRWLLLLLQKFEIVKQISAWKENVWKKRITRKDFEIRNLWRRQTRNDFRMLRKIFCIDAVICMYLLLAGENTFFKIRIKSITMKKFKKSHNTFFLKKLRNYLLMQRKKNNFNKKLI